jgi:hypothetical protein
MVNPSPCGNDANWNQFGTQLQKIHSNFCILKRSIEYFSAFALTLTAVCRLYVVYNSATCDAVGNCDALFNEFYCLHFSIVFFLDSVHGLKNDHGDIVWIFMRAWKIFNDIIMLMWVDLGIMLMCTKTPFFRKILFFKSTKSTCWNDIFLILLDNVESLYKLNTWTISYLFCGLYAFCSIPTMRFVCVLIRRDVRDHTNIERCADG